MAMLISVDRYNDFDNAPSPLTNSDQIQVAIKAASQIIEIRTGRTFVVLSLSPSPSPVATIEILNGVGSPRIFTHNAPIVTVDKIEWWDGIAWQEYDAVSYPFQIKANSNCIYFTNQSAWASGFAFYKGFQNIRVTYSYGYDTELPQDLQQACYMLAKMMIDDVTYSNLQSQADGEQSFTYFHDRRLPAVVESVIARYRTVY